MDNININIQQLHTSFSKFIAANKEKIDKITPKNPVITKDDPWRDEDFWDNLYERKKEK